MSSKESSPICFRVSAEERIRLEAAAVYVGESLSSFMRHAAIDIADSVMKEAGGAEAVLDNYREIQRRRAQFTR